MGEPRMPYRSTSELPSSVRGSLPSEAQHVYMRVVNDRLGAGHDDASAARQAWHAVSQGWSKDKKSGAWVRRSKKAEAPVWQEPGRGGTPTVGKEDEEDL